MDELQRLTSGTCTELERLAAAAATMGYSDSMALPAAHHITPSGPMPPASTLTPSLVTQYSDPYDLSRAHQYTVTRIDPQVRSVYEQPRGTQPPPTAHHQPPPTTLTTAVVAPSPAHTHGSTRTAVQFDRNGHYVRNNNQFSVPVSSTTPVPFGTENRGIALSVSTPVVPSVGTVGPGGVHTTTASVVGHGLVQYSPVLPDNTAAVVQHPVIQQTAVSLHTHNTTSATATTTTPDAQQHNHDTEEKKKKKKAKVESTKVKKKSDVLSEVDDNESCVLDMGVEDDGILPQPMESNGKMYYDCDQCKEKFEKPGQWRRHQDEHAMKKRNGLALEIKIEIIKRINAGEKQSDMAEEYGLNRSTIKSIIKKSADYMACWKKGMYHPDTKRLKGPKREDVERALYSWYQQALAKGIPISGPIMCNKARDFALKLGHSDFKATHGWLDRFKKRKNIVFGRSNAKKKEEEDVQMLEDMKLQDWQGQILHQIFMDYEANDIFHADEQGLLFRVLPMNAVNYKGERCSGGRHSKQRVTVLMCANMTGSEKFPLLVIGRFAKPTSFKNVKSLPVQYLSNKKAWMTSESFTAWLHDLDSWFVQQNRKVCVVIPSLPVHPKTTSLRAVRIVTSPTGFAGPMKHGIIAAIKRNYRRAVLEQLLSWLEGNKGKQKKEGAMRLSLLSCLHMLAAAWHAVTDVTINNSFQRAGMVKYGLWGMNLQAENSLGAENVALFHKLRTLGLKIPDMTFDDFVHFDDEVQVCNLMNDDDILAIVTGVCDEDEEDSDEDVDNDDDDGEDNHGPSTSEVEASLAVLRCHIQYQEDAQEMFRVLAHLEYLIYKGQGGKGVSVQSSTTVQ